MPVHELGVNEEGQPFYTMKFVHGRTLKKVIEDHHKSKADPSTHEVEQSACCRAFCRCVRRWLTLTVAACCIAI